MGMWRGVKGEGKVEGDWKARRGGKTEGNGGKGGGEGCGARHQALSKFK